MPGAGLGLCLGIKLGRVINKMKRKGTFTIEYGMLIIILVAALLGMFIYLRSALCGRWRQTVDSFGDGRLYFPYRTEILNREVIPIPP